MRLRRPKYTLRLFLIAMTAVCVWFGVTAHLARQQQATIVNIDQLGGVVTFESELASLPNRQAVHNYLSNAFQKRLVRDEIMRNTGIDTPLDVSGHRGDRVSVVRFSRRMYIGQFIRSVNSLGTVERLCFQDSCIGDVALRMLKPNQRLKYLDLRNNRVTDEGLKHLAEFPNLKVLVLTGNPITNVGLRHLHELTGVERIIYVGRGISANAVDELKRALPSCEVWVHPLPEKKRP